MNIPGTFLLRVLFSSFFIITFFVPASSQVTPDQIKNIPGAQDVLRQLDKSTLEQLQRGAQPGAEEQKGYDRNADVMVQPSKQEQSASAPASKNVIYNPNSTYGANIFSNAAVTSLSELSTPPLDYPIGVGDQLIVALWGGAEMQQSFMVSKDGSIFPQGIGKITIAGLTFEEARSIIQERFRRVVPSATRISVTMGQPRTVNINVVGEVVNPGPVAVSAFSNAFNVIATAGGATDYANLRQIVVKRSGKVVDEIDVYKYLQTGDFGKHIYLQNNDFVIIGFVEKKVQATGQFKRPMFYQLKKEEGIRALIKFAGGFNPDAASSILKVLRTEDGKNIQRDINYLEISKDDQKDFSLIDGDVVMVNQVRSEMLNKVEIKGEVNYPGQFELKNGEGILDLINRAGGFTRFTYLKRAYIFRGAGDPMNKKPERIEVDLSDFDSAAFSNPDRNIRLMPNDVVQLFSLSEFEEEYFIDIFGEVRKPGRYKRYQGMTLQDLLYLAGGFKESAEFGKIEIASVLQSDKLTTEGPQARSGIKFISVLPDLSLDQAAQKTELQAFDQVFVRRNPSFVEQENIEIRGMVKYPGIYNRMNKEEKITSFIQRAGGVLKGANLGGAVLYRSQVKNLRESLVERRKLDSLKGTPAYDSLRNVLESIEEPISIDLAKALNGKKKRDVEQDIVLKSGDLLFIPEINPFVTVRGSVQSPLRITFNPDKKKMTYYIDKSGGFGEKPWKKRSYVTYANGRSKRTKSFLFIRFYPSVREGATVTVPRRPETTDIGDIAKSALLATIPIVLTALALKYIQ